MDKLVISRVSDILLWLFCPFLFFSFLVSISFSFKCMFCHFLSFQELFDLFVLAPVFSSSGIVCFCPFFNEIYRMSEAIKMNAEMFDCSFVLDLFLSTKIFPLHIEACSPAKIFRSRLLCYVTRYLLTSICVTLTFDITCSDSEMCFHNS